MDPATAMMLGGMGVNLIGGLFKGRAENRQNARNRALADEYIGQQRNQLAGIAEDRRSAGLFEQQAANQVNQAAQQAATSNMLNARQGGALGMRQAMNANAMAAQGQGLNNAMAMNQAGQQRLQMLQGLRNEEQGIQGQISQMQFQKNNAYRKKNWDEMLSESLSGLAQGAPGLADSMRKAGGGGTGG